MKEKTQRRNSRANGGSVQRLFRRANRIGLERTIIDFRKAFGLESWDPASPPRRHSGKLPRKVPAREAPALAQFLYLGNAQGPFASPQSGVSTWQPRFANYIRAIVRPLQILADRVGLAFGVARSSNIYVSFKKDALLRIMLET